MLVSQDERDLQNVFSAYLCTALHRQRAKYLRRIQRQSEHEVPVETLELFPDRVGGELVPDVTAEYLCAGLSERDRRIVLLHVVAGIKLNAIAGDLGISVSATQKAYQRAVANMRGMAEANAFGF